METSSASVALAGLLLSGGCYTQKTASDELYGYEERTESDASAAPAPDAAVVVVDASTPKCTNTDPIALLLCQLTPPATTPQPQSTVPDLTGILDSLGGLGNIAEILGPVLGTTPTRPGTTPAPTGGLVDLVNLAGGLANIAQLFNQLLGGGAQSGLTGLFGGGAQSMQPTSLADFLAGLGIPVAGDPGMITEEPSASDCANPTTPAQQFACALQAAQ